MSLPHREPSPWLPECDECGAHRWCPCLTPEADEDGWYDGVDEWLDAREDDDGE